MEIRKLKVVSSSKSFVVVEYKNKIGSIHISEVSNGYVKDLQELFKKDDIVYGILLNEEKKLYSLKRGHSLYKKAIESGGGFFALQKYIEKFERY